MRLYGAVAAAFTESWWNFPIYRLSRIPFPDGQCTSTHTNTRITYIYTHTWKRRVTDCRDDFWQTIDPPDLSTTTSLKSLGLPFFPRFSNDIQRITCGILVSPEEKGSRLFAMVAAIYTVEKKARNASSSRDFFHGSLNNELRTKGGP